MHPNEVVLVVRASSGTCVPSNKFDVTLGDASLLGKGYVAAFYDQVARQKDLLS